MILSKKLVYKNGVKSIQVKTTEIVHTGRYVKLDKEEYFVYNSVVSKNKGEHWYSDICLIKEKDLFVETKFNEKIQGSSLKGRVKKIVSKEGKAYMHVDFTEGLKQKGSVGQIENKNFVDIAYKTFYSKTNTGFFPTPEVDDLVVVQFNDIDENNLVVSWSVENEESDRFNDINQRNYKNNYADFILNNENLNINVKSKIEVNSKNINMNAEGFTTNTKDYIALGSQGYIGIEGKDKSTIYSDSIEIKSSKGDINVFSGKDVLIKGITIHNN